MKTTTPSPTSYMDFAVGELQDRPIVLVVHASPTVRRALLVTLDLDGFDVRVVGDACEGVLRLMDDRPRVVIAEMGVDCEGVANLFAQLRSHAATRDTPLVLVSTPAVASPMPEWSTSGVHHVPLEEGVSRLLDVLHEALDPRGTEA